MLTLALSSHIRCCCCDCWCCDCWCCCCCCYFLVLLVAIAIVCYIVHLRLQISIVFRLEACKLTFQHTHTKHALAKQNNNQGIEYKKKINRNTQFSARMYLCNNNNNNNNNMNNVKRWTMLYISVNMFGLLANCGGGFVCAHCADV